MGVGGGGGRFRWWGLGLGGREGEGGVIFRHGVIVYILHIDGVMVALSGNCGTCQTNAVRLIRPLSLVACQR